MSEVGNHIRRNSATVPLFTAGHFPNSCRSLAYPLPGLHKPRATTFSVTAASSLYIEPEYLPDRRICRTPVQI